MLGCSLRTSMRQLPSTHPPPFKHGAHRVCPTQFKSTSIKCFPPFSLFQTKMNILTTNTHPPLKLLLHHYSVSTSYNNNEPMQQKLIGFLTRKIITFMAFHVISLYRKKLSYLESLALRTVSGIKTKLD